MCGIAGFFGKPGKESLFNYTGFCYIFAAQESRGGDSCGVAYSTNKENAKYAITWGSRDDDENRSKVSDFLQNKNGEFEQKLFRAPYNIIAHARGASNKTTANRDGAHPFTFGNIIGVHNGVIRNTKEMAEIFKVDISGIEVDSEAMFKILSEGHMDALSIYEGDAVLVWIDITTEDVYVWAGKGNKKWSTTKQEYEYDYERTIHMLSCDAGVYISSEFIPLEIFKGITNTEGKVYHFLGNHITRISKGEIAESIPVTRKTVYDYKEEKGLETPNTFRDATNTNINAAAKLNLTDDTDAVVDKKKWASPSCIKGITNTHYSKSKKDEISLYYGLYEMNGFIHHTLSTVNYPTKGEGDITCTLSGNDLYYHGLKIKKSATSKFFEILYSGKDLTDCDFANVAACPVPTGWWEMLKRSSKYSKTDSPAKIHWNRIRVEEWLTQCRPTTDSELYFHFGDNEFYYESSYKFRYPEVSTEYTFSYGWAIKEDYKNPKLTEVYGY